MNYHKLLAITAIIIFMVVPVSYAVIINVPADYSTIQNGINASSDGDTILVAPGTYYENINFTGKEILLTSNFIFESDSSYIFQTILDGDSLDTVVLFNSDEDSLSILAYLTITNGFGTGPYGNGGGVSCWQGSPAIIGCNIEYNYVVDGYGGGIYIMNGSPVIKYCLIHHNTAIDQTVGYTSGGGIWVRYGMPVIFGNKIYNNHASRRGGGAGGFGLMNFYENEIFNNSCDRRGGGVHVNGSIGDLRFNLIYNNSAESGGGICLESYYVVYTKLTSINNTIYGNTAEDGGGISCYTTYVGTEAEVTNTILYENTGDEFYTHGGHVNLDVTYSNVENGYAGVGNIDCAPMFCAPDSGDFYLMEESCCIGAGSDSLGNPDTTINIGALGIGCSGSACDYVAGDVNGSDGYNGLDITYGVNFFKGGPAPAYQCECTPGNTWYVSGDVNGSCSYNGLDITYGVAYFKGGPAPVPCPSCPPN